MVTLVEGVATIDDLDTFLDRLDEIGSQHDVACQAFDARMVVDRAHLERAVELANRAFDRGKNVARDRGVEILLYAAGRRQIDQALAMGVDEGEGPVVVVIDGPAGGGEDGAAAAVRDLLDVETPTIGEYDRERVMDFFEVTDAELGATDGDLADLVRERVALLTVNR